MYFWTFILILSVAFQSIYHPWPRNIILAVHHYSSQILAIQFLLFFSYCQYLFSLSFHSHLRHLISPHFFFLFPCNRFWSHKVNRLNLIFILPKLVAQIFLPTCHADLDFTFLYCFLDRSYFSPIIPCISSLAFLSYLSDLT
jgi:hypothetical protein